MQKWVVMAFVVWSLAFPCLLSADECMEGDCENGFGAGFTEDNKIYEGEWRDGMPDGKGKLYEAKGKVIEGIWEKGELVREDKGDKKKDSGKDH